MTASDGRAGDRRGRIQIAVPRTAASFLPLDDANRRWSYLAGTNTADDILADPFGK